MFVDDFFVKHKNKKQDANEFYLGIVLIMCAKYKIGCKTFYKIFKLLTIH